MKKKLLICVLALAVVFTFSAVPGFAASKQVVQVSEKVYVKGSDGEYLDSSWKTEYDKKGRITKKTTFNYGENNEETYKYNSKGKLKTVYITFDGEKDRKEEYTYNKGKVNKIIDYFYENGKYNKETTTKYTYKSKKITQKSTAQSYNDFKYVSYYNKKGQKTKMEYSWYTDTNEERKANVWTYTYYKNGNLKKYINKYGSEIIESMEYDKNGLLTKEVRQSYGSKTTTTYKYNSAGLVKEKIVKNSDKTTTKYTYKYSNYYGSTKKYPKTIKCYENGKLYSRTEKRYKKISLADTSYIPERGYFRI